eukprot:gene29438-5783_t
MADDWPSKFNDDLFTDDRFTDDRFPDDRFTLLLQVSRRPVHRRQVHDDSSSGGSMCSLDLIMRMEIKEDVSSYVASDTMEYDYCVPQGFVERLMSESSEERKARLQQLAKQRAKRKYSLGPTGSVDQRSSAKIQKHVQKRNAIRSQFLKAAVVIMNAASIEEEGSAQVSAQVLAQRASIWEDIKYEIYNADMTRDNKSRSFPLLWFLRTLVVAIKANKVIAGPQREIMAVLEEYGLNFPVLNAMRFARRRGIFKWEQTSSKEYTYTLALNQSISPYVLVVRAFRFLIERVKKIRKSVVDSEPGFVFESQAGDLRQANDFVMAMFVEGLDYIADKLTSLTLEWIHFCKLDTFNFVGVNEFVMHDTNAKAARVWKQAAEEAGRKKG